MPEYRYFANDLLTNEIIADMPFYGVFLERRLSSSGQGNASFKLETGKHVDSELIQGSEPGRTAIYCERDGVLIWGGIVWARTYDTRAKVCNLNLGTFESYFKQCVLEAGYIASGVEQITAFRTVLEAMQAQEGSNILLDLSNVTGASGVTRNFEVESTSFTLVDSVINQMVAVDNGLDYTIEAQTGPSIDTPTRKVLMGYPQLGNTDPAFAPGFDYPGSIDNYYWPESALRGATKIAGLGQGTGETALVAVYTDYARLQQGWPALWSVNSYKDITTQDVLDARTALDATKFRVPYSVPTFTLKPNTEFEMWNALGMQFNVHIQDARFPDGKTINSRMVGWALKPGDSDGVESIDLLLEGDDND